MNDNNSNDKNDNNNNNNNNNIYKNDNSNSNSNNGNNNYFDVEAIAKIPQYIYDSGVFHFFYVYLYISFFVGKTDVT
jgi:hypothetical protein